MLFDRTPQEEAIELIRAALTEELRESPTLRQLAENMDAIGIHYGVPVQVTLAWIHERALGKRWTAAEFRRWCELRAEAIERHIYKPAE